MGINREFQDVNREYQRLMNARQDNVSLRDIQRCVASNSWIKKTFSRIKVFIKTRGEWITENRVQHLTLTDDIKNKITEVQNLINQNLDEEHIKNLINELESGNAEIQNLISSTEMQQLAKKVRNLAKICELTGASDTQNVNSKMLDNSRALFQIAKTVKSTEKRVRLLRHLNPFHVLDMKNSSYRNEFVTFLTEQENVSKDNIKGLYQKFVSNHTKNEITTIYSTDQKPFARFAKDKELFDLAQRANLEENKLLKPVEFSSEKENKIVDDLLKEIPLVKFNNQFESVLNNPNKKLLNKLKNFLYTKIVQDPLSKQNDTLYEKLNKIKSLEYQLGFSEHYTIVSNPYQSQSSVYYNERKPVVPYQAATIGIVKHFPKTEISKPNTFEIQKTGSESTARLDPTDQEGFRAAVEDTRYFSKHQLADGFMVGISDQLAVNKGNQNNDSYDMSYGENWSLAVVTDGASGASSKIIADIAKDSVVDYVHHYLDKCRNIQQLSQLIIDAFKTAQDNVNKKQGLFQSGATTMTVLLKFEDAYGDAKVLTATIGDSKAAKVTDDGVEILYEDSIIPPRANNDPGGQIRLTDNSGGDFRNFQITLSNANESLFIVGSDGLFDQFEPYTHGLTPYQAYQALTDDAKEKVHQPDENDTWITPNALSELKENQEDNANMHLKYMQQNDLTEEFQKMDMWEVIEESENVAETLYDHIRERGEVYHAWRECHPHDKEPKPGIEFEWKESDILPVRFGAVFRKNTIVKKDVKSDDVTILTL